MSLATICASAWVRCGLGLPVPNVWVSASEVTAAELVEFSREALRMVLEAHEWQALIGDYEAALSVGNEQFVTLPADFGRLVPDTVWVSNFAWPARGPLSEAEYEYLSQPPRATAGPVFRIAAGGIQILGNPAPSGTLTLRYVSGRPVVSGTGRAASWVTDADTTLVDERLVTLATIAMWRDAKGLPAQGAITQYQSALSRAKAQDRPVGVMGMGGNAVPREAAVAVVVR